MGIIRGIGTILALKTTITNLTITSEKIKEEKKILVVSDIHVDFVFSTFHLQKIKNLIKEEKPDFVLILGDLFNKAHPGYEKAYEIFKDETTPIYAVVGNHDIMGDKELIYQIPNLSPIKILTNESTEIDSINLV
ncbi:metallophosphoesterase [bacterium]|nr:metallophosphoesterase [bacterium]